jgi:hypothetical protein
MLASTSTDPLIPISSRRIEAFSFNLPHGSLDTTARSALVAAMSEFSFRYETELTFATKLNRLYPFCLRELQQKAGRGE